MIRDNNKKNIIIFKNRVFIRVLKLNKTSAARRVDDYLIIITAFFFFETTFRLEYL